MKPVKLLLKSLLRPLGLGIHHLSDDPVLIELDRVRGQLRLERAHAASWHEKLVGVAKAAKVRSLLHAHQPDLVIDVGANRGQFADEMRAWGYTGPILSIEPQGSLATALKDRARTSALPWRVEHGAAGETAGELRLHTFADDTFSSFHQPNAAALSRFGKLVAPTGSEVVEVKPLDQWLEASPYAQAGRILLKTDTQGHDLAVLRGSASVLQRTVVVLAEGSLVPLYDHVSTPSALAQVLEPLGFRSAGEYPISHDDRDCAVLEVDCIFTRRADEPPAPAR